MCIILVYAWRANHSLIYLSTFPVILVLIVLTDLLFKQIKAHQINQSTTLILHFALCRYGPVFKTSLVGRPLIVSTDPDFNYFIFQQENKLFQCWYPDTFRKILGRENLADLHGSIHKYVKNMVLNLVGPESLKTMLPEIEQVAQRTLQQWSCEDSVELKEASANVR